MFETILIILLSVFVGAPALITFFAGRALWRGGKRLMGQILGENKLPGQTVSSSREAQDVVVERVDEPSGHSHGKGRGPQAPADVAEHRTQSSRQTSQRTERHSSQTHHHRHTSTVSPTPQREYVRLDVDEGATANQIAEVLRNYEDDEVLGEKASTVIDTLRRAERRRRIVWAELDGAFQRGSISWQRFAAPAQAALDALLRNSCLLANRIQAFDTEGYLRLRADMSSSASSATSQQVASRERRWMLYREALDSLDVLQEANEALLLELDKLTTELSVISEPGSMAESEAIIDEIHRLVEEAKYYR